MLDKENIELEVILNSKPEFEVDTEITVEEVEPVEIDVQLSNPSDEHDRLLHRDFPDQHPISAITGLDEALENKVDKEEGKGLSSNDYTDDEKFKLQGIESGAEVNKIEAEDINKSITMKLSSLGY